MPVLLKRALCPQAPWVVSCQSSYEQRYVQGFTALSSGTVRDAPRSVPSFSLSNGLWSVHPPVHATSYCSKGGMPSTLSQKSHLLFAILYLLNPPFVVKVFNLTIDLFQKQNSQNHRPLCLADPDLMLNHSRPWPETGVLAIR